LQPAADDRSPMASEPCPVDDAASVQQHEASSNIGDANIDELLKKILQLDSKYF